MNTDQVTICATAENAVNFPNCEFPVLKGTILNLFSDAYFSFWTPVEHPLMIKNPKFFKSQKQDI